MRKQNSRGRILQLFSLGLITVLGLAPARAQQKANVADQLYIEVSALGSLDYFYDHKLGLQKAGEAMGVKTEYVGPAEYDISAMVTAFERFAIPHLRNAGGGSIIHMASVTGHLGHPGVTVYGASKGGLMALARGQAVELAKDNIRVNTISPGTVDSPMLHRFLAENASDIEKARAAFDHLHPRGKVGTIEEVAAVFVFLASDEAANITATDIRCDGGYAAGGRQPTS